MNKVILLGNVCKDLEVTVTKKDMAIGKTTIAVNEGFGDNVKTTFVNIVVFGSRVDSLQKYLLKGAGVLVDGKLDINNVQDEDGNWNTYVSVIVNDIKITKFVDVEDNKNNKSKNNRKGGKR